MNESTDLANIGKFRLITRTIEEIEAMKLLGYEGIIDPNSEIEKLILFAPRVDDAEEQYQLSITCEARKQRNSVLIQSAVELRSKQPSDSANELRRISLPSKLTRTAGKRTLLAQSSNPYLEKTDPKDSPRKVTRLHTVD